VSRAVHAYLSREKNVFSESRKYEPVFTEFFEPKIIGSFPVDEPDAFFLSDLQ
jgi:hypothetical protein